LNLVDGASSFNSSNGFSQISHIPNIELFVSSSSSKIFAVRGNGNGVNASIMGLEGGSDLKVGVPNLESSVPSS